MRAEKIARRSRRSVATREYHVLKLRIHVRERNLAAFQSGRGGAIIRDCEVTAGRQTEELFPSRRVTRRVSNLRERTKLVIFRGKKKKGGGRIYVERLATRSESGERCSDLALAPITADKQCLSRGR